MDYVLCHHGVKGQKWGVRRYQNSDGSLTPAGLRRYNTGDSDLSDIAFTRLGKQSPVPYSSAKRIKKDIERGVPKEKAIERENTRRSVIAYGTGALLMLGIHDVLNNGLDGIVGKSASMVGRSISKGSSYIKAAASKGFFNLTFDPVSGMFIKNVNSNLVSIGGSTSWDAAKETGARFIKDAMSYIKK